MCGIAGVLSAKSSAPPALDALARMAAALRHRGPDEFGIYRDARAGLAHARLSIIDLAAGQQPLSNEDGTLWVVFNGEIFNYLELREDLVSKGHRFRTRSDTEVIVHAFEEWGEDAFARFNGQFAIALWNSREERLVLARDPFGVRPLFIAEREGGVAFASEIKAIFAGDPSLPRAIDPVGLDQTFTFWSVVPPRSVFAGIEELRPGHARTYDARGVRERAFFRLSFPESSSDGFRGTIAEAAEAVRAALREATRLRMVRADVTVGSYLSGGLDSSLVATLARDACGGRLRTFSLRFADAEYDETPHQRTMVASLGSDHREITVTKGDIAAVFPDVVSHAERPILRTAPAPMFLLSSLVRREGIKVVLTGEGADEMFAGYDLFREGKVRRFWARHPESTLRPRLLEKLYPYLARSPVGQRAMARAFFGRNLEAWRAPGFAHQTRWRTTSALKRFFSSSLVARLAGRDSTSDLLGELPPELSRWRPLAQDQYLEIRTLLTGYILASQGDRMLMANSVEGRFPFLDANVVALASSLPPEHMLHALDEKHVLKRASSGLVPASIVARKKQPYRAPDALSFASGDAVEWVGEALSERAVADAGLFDVAAVSALWRKIRLHAGDATLSNTDNMALVGVLSTQLLHERMVRSSVAPRPIVLRTLVDRLAGSVAAPTESAWSP